MKKVLIGIIILLLLSWGVWAAMHRSGPASSSNPAPVATSTPSGQETGNKTYSDPAGRFTFQYPAAFSATGEENASSSPTGWSTFSPEPGRVLARVKVPRDYLPNTNFSEAWFTVGWSNDSEAIRTCTKNLAVPGAAVSDATIDGVVYKEMKLSDAAAGNRYDTIAYRAILDGDCISLEYTIHYGNIQNYDPSMGIKEFDEAALASKLDAIAKSFVWNVNSD